MGLSPTGKRKQGVTAMHKIVLSSVVTAILLAGGAQHAQAAGYGSFVINNPTVTTIWSCPI
jgi:hypothetical protein